MFVLIPALTLASLFYVGYLRFNNKLKLGFSYDKWVFTEINAGVIIAFVPVTIAFFVIYSAGYVEIVSQDLDVLAFFRSLGELTAYALIEELIFRVGLLLALIHLTKNVWLAVLIEIVLFGLGHIANPGATSLTVFSNSLGGLMYSLAFIFTGRIWMPTVLHLFWNFSQGFYGFNISGTTEYSDFFMNIRPVGNELLSGGQFGFEGSLIGIAARIVILAFIVVIAKWLATKNPLFNEQRESILPADLRTSGIRRENSKAI